MRNQSRYRGIGGSSSTEVRIIINIKIKFKKMNANPPVLFSQDCLQSFILTELAAKDSEVEVILHMNPLQQSQEMSQEDSSNDILLQLVDGHVLQRSLGHNVIVSVLKCDYDMHFQIIRKASQVPNRVGEAEGIKFSHRETPEKVLILMAKKANKVDLQRFCRILGKNYIVQLGFHTSFKANKKIGRGMTACVYNALNLANGKEVAIKSFKRSVYFSQDNGNGKISFMKEFKILTELKHRNLCQLYSVFQTENSTYVILELYPLSLYGYLQKCGFPNLEQAKVIMINLLEGIAYLHEKGIMHRDLKLENIMVKKDQVRSGRVIPVIVDLGLAEYTDSTKYLYTRCGTPGYVAPEVLKIKSTDPVQTYSCACDVFSLGVIFHILLFKKPVFEGKEVKEVIKKNNQCSIDFTNQNFMSLDESGRDLLSKMLDKDPNNRISAADALRHPFLSQDKRRLQIENQNIFPTTVSILT